MQTDFSGTEGESYRDWTTYVEPLGGRSERNWGGNLAVCTVRGTVSTGAGRTRDNRWNDGSGGLCHGDRNNMLERKGDML